VTVEKLGFGYIPATPFDRGAKSAGRRLRLAQGDPFEAFVHDLAV
jgi:hypothetical protein